MWDPIYLTNKRKFTCNTLQLNGCFICITIPLGVYCTARESCIILARKSLPGLERRLTCLIKINSTLNSSVWARRHKYLSLHFPFNTLYNRRLPDFANTIDSGQKVKETICNELVYLNTNHFPGKSQHFSAVATESSTTVNRSRVRVIRVILVDS